ncbi:TPA: hypothetical protein ACJE7I_001123 [Campylobacter coli]
MDLKSLENKRLYILKKMCVFANAILIQLKEKEWKKQNLNGLKKLRK